MAGALLADSSGLLALADGGEPDHDRIVALLATPETQLITTDFVLAEMDYMVLSRLGPAAERALLQQVAAGAFHREPVSESDLERAFEIAERFAEHALGITDSTLMAISERLAIRHVLTLDHRHFGVYRDRKGRALKLLPGH